MFEAFVLAALLSQPRLPVGPDVQSLEGDWMVQEVGNIQIMPEAPVTLTFGADRVSGLASCNSYQGSYTISNDRLSTKSILTTMKACDDARMSQERDFLTVLRAAERFEVRRDGTLRIEASTGKTILARRK